MNGEAALSAFQNWRRRTPARSLALNRIADSVEVRQKEFVQPEAENNGEPLH